MYFVYAVFILQVTVNAKSELTFDDHAVLPGKKRVAHSSSVGSVKSRCLMFVSAGFPVSWVVEAAAL